MSTPPEDRPRKRRRRIPRPVEYESENRKLLRGIHREFGTEDQSIVAKICSAVVIAVVVTIVLFLKFGGRL
ncbi:MAG: hypothetical protein HS116_07300 [Planctomycetes bacterium]|nr:hypothetical protein [Planctomycetota bacterium]